jgi:hypothetical protein
MDTSSASKSFSVQVTISIPNNSIKLVNRHTLQQPAITSRQNNSNQQGESFKAGVQAGESNALVHPVMPAGKIKGGAI